MKLLQKCKNDGEISEEIHLKDICNCKDAKRERGPEHFSRASQRKYIRTVLYTRLYEYDIIYDNKKIIKFKI